MSKEIKPVVSWDEFCLNAAKMFAYQLYQDKCDRDMIDGEAEQRKVAEEVCDAVKKVMDRGQKKT